MPMMVASHFNYYAWERKVAHGGGWTSRQFARFALPTLQVPKTLVTCTDPVRERRVFQPPRDRDAWATIRGYLYQIDCTIDRWLHLGTQQCLELVRGEDIDFVGQLLSAETGTLAQRQP